jgi:diadenosine tetraphosphate (Ap4A) HIT family hydrolase
VAGPGSTLIHERVAACRDGSNPTIICRLPSGWAVLGDHQFLRGYSLLLPDPVVTDLSDLVGEGRRRFLWDMSLLGQAVGTCTDAARLNYEILGNAEPALHAHVWPRFADEPDEFRRGPVGRYPAAQRASEPFSPERHGPLQAALRDELRRLVTAEA